MVYNGNIIIVLMMQLSVDNGKPVERQGRKAKGPNAQAMAAWPPKWEFF